MKTRWIGGVVVAAGCLAWFVFGPTRVTDARVCALVEQLGPLVEAGTGGSLGDNLRTEVLTQDELRAHFEALNLASGEYVLVPAHTEEQEDGTTAHFAESTDWDALWASKSYVAHYDPRDHTIRVCSTNLDAAAEVLGEAPVGFLKVVMLHELVHAIDGSAHGERWIADSARDDEPAHAGNLLFEGHAALVARRLAERSGLTGEARASEANWSEAWGWTAQYLRSAEYLERVERDGGRAAIDAALRDPPATVDEVLYPELAEAVNTPAADEVVLTDALLDLAESRGDCDGPRVRELPRHEFEGRLYRASTSAGRSLAAALTQHAEVRGAVGEGGWSDVSIARACVFAEPEDAEEYLDELRGVTEERWRAEREQHLEVFDTLEDHTLELREISGDDWEGLHAVRRWQFSDTVSRLVSGHTTTAGELEIRHAYARRGRVLLELFPAARDGGPLTPGPRFDDAFALIPDAR